MENKSLAILKSTQDPQQLARGLYEHAYPARQIARLTGYSVRRIEQLIVEQKWKKRSLDNPLDQPSILQMMRTLLRIQTEAALSQVAGTGQLLDAAEIDSLSKLLAPVLKAEMQAEQYIRFCQEFLEYWGAKDREIALQLSPSLEEFLVESLHRLGVEP